MPADNEGLAQWRHYLAWKEFAIFARCWLALEMYRKAATSYYSFCFFVSKNKIFLHRKFIETVLWKLL